jgi:hypothetical protein
LDQIFFVHEGAGQLAGFSMGNAAARHGEAPTQVFGFGPSGSGGTGVVAELGVLTGGPLNGFDRLFETINGAGAGAFRPIWATHQDIVGVLDPGHGLTGRLLGAPNAAGHRLLFLGRKPLVDTFTGVEAAEL